METNYPQIEKMVITNLWQNYEKLDIFIVNPNWFTDNRTKDIWVKSLKWIAEKGKEDVIGFDHINKTNVFDMIIECKTLSIIPQFFEDHVAILRAESDKKCVWNLLSHINGEFLIDTETAIKMVRSWITEYDEKQILNVSTHSPKETVLNFMQDLDYKKSLGNTPEFSCGDGFKKLDIRIWGFNRGELCVIGGATGKGKSTLALNFCHSFLNNNKKVLYFSTEMSASEKMGRYIALSCEIPAWKFRRTDFDDTEMGIINKKLEEIASQELFHICDIPSPTYENIEATVKRVKPQVVIVDHLQRCSYGKEDRNDLAVGKFVKGLKSLARLSDCPIIILSQLNRGDGISPNRKPQLRDLKESSGIEQEADIVIFLSQDTTSYQSEDLEVLDLEVAKNRHGSVGYDKINFQKNILKMFELDNV